MKKIRKMAFGKKILLAAVCALVVCFGTSMAFGGNNVSDVVSMALSAKDAPYEASFEVKVTDKATEAAASSVTVSNSSADTAKASLTVSALDAEGNSINVETAYQWQILVDEDADLWVDIQGQNAADIALTLGMVNGALNDNKVAQVRCVATAAGEEAASDPVEVKVGEAIDEAAGDAIEGDSQDAPKIISDAVVEEHTVNGDAADGEGEGAEGVGDAAGEEGLSEEADSNAEGGIAPMSLNNTKSRSMTRDAGGAASDVKKTYNIVINYKFENNEIVSDPYTANLAEGSSFSATVTFPTVQGYLPYVNDEQKNSIELNYPSVSEDVTINVVYKPTNVNYTVIHYQQNVDNDQYTEVARETKQGLTASQVPEVAKTYEGFYSLIYERPAIAADDSTVIEVYYDRYYYLMNFDMDGGYGTEPIYARYGAPIGTVNAPTKAGYEFKGWSLTKPAGNVGEEVKVETIPDTMPAESRIYHAVWEADETVRVTIVFWGENADDEKYSYLSEESLYVKRQDGFMYTQDGNTVVCGYEEHTHTDDCYELSCNTAAHEHNSECYTKEYDIEHTHSEVGGGCYTLSCTHTHTTDCYSVGAGSGLRYLVKTSKPSQTLTDIGNGIYTYSTYSGFNNNRETKHYYVNIGDEWYKGHGVVTGDDDTYSISFNCSHTHTDDCYTLTCGMNEHTHTDACLTCGKSEHTHSKENNCYKLICGKTEHKHSVSCYTSGVKAPDSTLWKYVKSDEVDLEQDGSSVVNVYYDRVEYSVQFYENQSCSSNREYTSLKITAKWGANIQSKWPNYEYQTGRTSSSWYVKDKSNTWQNSIQVMPVGGAKFWGPKEGNSKYTATYYVEVLPENQNDTGVAQARDERYYKVHHTDTSNSSGNVTDEERYGIDGFTINNSISTSNGSSYGGSKFYYTRNSYKLNFNNGYEVTRAEDVKFEASLGTYKDYVPEAPETYEPGSVEFAGWYQNPSCTGEEYKLDEHTMPSHNLILYAKWVPVNRTVKFYLTELSTEVYTPKNAAVASFTVSHGDTLNEDYVDANLTIVAMNAAKPNGDYTFVMWYYYENGVKKPFDPSTEIRKDLTLYGEWSSNTLKQYTVQYVLAEKGADGNVVVKTGEDGKPIKVADDLTGSGLAGTTKTFDAKGGTELYTAYQEGYFPTVQSQSLLLDIDEETLTITFEYVPMEAVPYTVKYVDKDTGESLSDDKVVSDNRKAVVTETFKPITGYMPDAYQKRLVVTADGENILYFYYTKDTEHAYYKITHYIQNTDGTTWSEYASSQAIGDIGTRYTSSPVTISGYTYKETKYMVNSTEVTDIAAEGAKLTENGLEINLYYTRNEYPYQVRYLEQGSGNVLHDPKAGTGKYGQVISESAIDIDGYNKVDPTSATLNIRVDEGEGAPNLNIITFYYKEQEVTINYVAVGPEGVTDFGSVSPESETVKVKSGTAQGSTPTAGDGFKFVGWYKDKACTQLVDASWVTETDNKIIPQKTDGKNVAATYYAKFERDTTSLTITKQAAEGTTFANGEAFVFTVTGPDNYSRQISIHGAGSVTIDGLEVGGEYTVTESDSWSWRYGSECDKTDGKVTLGQDASENKVTFTNSKSNNSWLDFSGWCQNLFKGSSIETGGVAYKATAESNN